MKDLVELLKKDPGAVKWGGGSRGSVDQISIARIAREAGVDPAKINYLPFQGGGEASAAIVGGYVTVGTSGWSELAPLIRSGKLRALAVTSGERLPGNPTPTLKEQGFDIEVVNWRGVYGAPGITAEQKKALTRAVVAATRQKSWTEAAASNAWSPALLTGTEFEKFVDAEQGRIEASMREVGLIK
jgi:putative tricarboxylic transport membrane protein